MCMCKGVKFTGKGRQLSWYFTGWDLILLLITTKCPCGRISVCQRRNAKIWFFNKDKHIENSKFDAFGKMKKQK